MNNIKKNQNVMKEYTFWFRKLLILLVPESKPDPEQNNIELKNNIESEFVWKVPLGP
jgi:hypothetical protein